MLIFLNRKRLVVKSMEKMNMMNLSTACISENTADALNKQVFCKENMQLVIYPKDVYGWFIYIPTSKSIDSLEIPEDLKRCLNFAAKNGCELLCFDRDVEFDASDGLPEYKW